MRRSGTGRVPLHDVCIGGNSECMSLLLDYMSDVDVADHNKQTALHHAAYNGEIKCLRLLTQKGTSGLQMFEACELVFNVFLLTHFLNSLFGINCR